MKFIRCVLVVGCMVAFSVSAGPVVVVRPPVVIARPVSVSRPPTPPPIVAKPITPPPPNIKNSASPPVVVAPITSPIQMSHSLSMLTNNQNCHDPKNKNTVGKDC